MGWGQHLILNATKCAPWSIRSAPHIAAFTKTLVHRIDMVAYGPPQIVMFGTGDKKGYTLVQLIETSNIVAHFVEELDDLYLDVFSCKPFTPETVETIVQSYFRPLSVSCQVLERRPPPISLSDAPQRHGADAFLR